MFNVLLCFFVQILMSHQKPSDGSQHDCATVAPKDTVNNSRTEDPITSLASKAVQSPSSPKFEDITKLIDRHGKLPQEEKYRRKANKLCFFCGQQGHFTGPDCPKLQKREKGRAEEAEWDDGYDDIGAGDFEGYEDAMIQDGMDFLL